MLLQVAHGEFTPTISSNSSHNANPAVIPPQQPLLTEEQDENTEQKSTADTTITERLQGCQAGCLPKGIQVNMKKGIIELETKKQNMESSLANKTPFTVMLTPTGAPTASTDDPSLELFSCWLGGTAAISTGSCTFFNQKKN